MSQTLLLVYNADSSVFAVASDFVKKLAAPDKYDCQLCMVTYGAIRMKNPWKEYLNSLPYKKSFLHRDEFKTSYPAVDISLPAILLTNKANLPEILVSSEEINNIKSVQELIMIVEEKLSKQKLG